MKQIFTNFEIPQIWTLIFQRERRFSFNGNESKFMKDGTIEELVTSIILTRTFELLLISLSKFFLVINIAITIIMIQF